MKEFQTATEIEKLQEEALQLLKELIDQFKNQDNYVEFMSPDTEVTDGKLIGDETAPYFPLAPDEYLKQKEQDQYFALTPEEFEEQREQDEHAAYFTLENFFNDLVCLTVHAPIALPPDPKNLDAALAQADGPLWDLAVRKELNNFDSRGILNEAEQTGHAMKTKLVLKYTYTDSYELKRKVRFVVCGYSQRPDVDYGDTYAPTTTNTVTSIICMFCAHHGYHIATFDVEAAFLEGKADRR